MNKIGEHTVIGSFPDLVYLEARPRHMEMNKELIQACKGKDRIAQKRLYDILLPYLASVSRRYLLHQADLNDTLQEAFIRLFKSIDSFDDQRASFKTWAVRIVINCSLRANEQHKKNKTLEFDPLYHDRREEPVILSELSKQELMAKVKKMPIDLFEVFNMVAVDGYTHKEVANALAIDESLSRKRLSRARKWISDHLESERLVGIKKSS